ncbi:MAG: hypothetical protein KGL04_03810 [Elusimicrobia bacterium]|nr:hypothetical protein [Elusimicrobiota bacterium]
MNKRRLGAVTAILAFTCLSISARAAEEALPEQLALDLPAAAPNFMPFTLPIGPVALLAPSQLVLPSSSLELPAPISRQLPLFSNLAQPAAPEIPNLPASLAELQAQDPAARAPRAAAEKMVSAMTQSLQEPIKAAGDAHSSADSSIDAGRQIESIMTGEAYADGVGYPSEVLAARGGHGAGHAGSIPWMPVNPAEFYAQALAEAAHTAERYGVKPGNVNLGDIKGTFSSMDAREISYEFYIKPGKAEDNSGIIYVDFSRSWAQAGQRMGARVATFITNPKDHDVEPRHFGAAELAQKVIYAPRAALDAARKRFPDLGLNASYLLSLDSRDGGNDFWYHIYDSGGHAVAVNARTAEAADMTGNASSAKSPKKRAIADALQGLSREDIESAAQHAAQYKGRPWSQTEYEAGVYEIQQKLIARGATKEDIKLFRRLCDEAPIQGGSFNPWAGD